MDSETLKYWRTERGNIRVYIFTGGTGFQPVNTGKMPVPLMMIVKRV